MIKTKKTKNFSSAITLQYYPAMRVRSTRNARSTQQPQLHSQSAIFAFKFSPLQSSWSSPSAHLFARPHHAHQFPLPEHTQPSYQHSKSLALIVLSCFQHSSSISATPAYLNWHGHRKPKSSSRSPANMACARASSDIFPMFSCRFKVYLIWTGGYTAGIRWWQHAGRV